MKLPDTADSGTNRFSVFGLKKCQEKCTQDCHCTTYSMFVYANGSLSSDCVTWSGDLIDLRDYIAGGQDLYIRSDGKTKKSKRGFIIGFSVGIPALGLFSLAIFCDWKRMQQRVRASAASIEMEVMVPRDTVENQLLPPMDFGTILKATDNFSQEIGQGGFGKVFKGQLATGQEIAVKKLSVISSQGTHEFYTEVTSIERLRHINIVRLYGWSVHQHEKLLIYEYLENGSLERHLFGGELNWQTRFGIIKGVAQGLAYIEEGSYNMIVHRDLKPANILLDRDMTPKISDFGLARMCGRSRNEDFTKHPAGTHGYMSPEYAGDGIYSAQSDIFSFGVTVLEIVSGKKNRLFTSYMGPNTNLLGYAWIKLNEGAWVDIVDPKIISDSLAHPQVLRCIEVGLLCVQHNTTDRPKMSVVVAALEDVTLPIPTPKRPGFFMDEDQRDIASSSSTYRESSTSTSHQFTGPITQVQAR